MTTIEEYFQVRKEGGKRGHKGGSKRFTNPQQLEADRLKEEKAKAWRRQRGEESSSEEEEEEANDASNESGSSDDDGVSFQKDNVSFIAQITLAAMEGGN